MAKRRGRKTVQHQSFGEYYKVARHFYEAAGYSMELEYWTAAGVLIVHSAIAYADALCIKNAGAKSIGEDHEDAVAFLDSVIADGADTSKAINQLKRIIEEKTKVSYLGELYSEAQTREMWKRLERFIKWAEEILTR